MFDKNKLRVLRVARGWTLKTLAEKSGVSYVVVRRLESGGNKGNRQPRLDTLTKLARALLVPVEALLSAPEGEPRLGGHFAWGTDQLGGQVPLTFSSSNVDALPQWFRYLAQNQIDPEQLLAEMKRKTERIKDLMFLSYDLSDEDYETWIAFARFLQERSKEQEQKPKQET